MTGLGKKTIGVLILVLLLGAAAGLKTLSGITSDRYAGEPRVVGLPPGYDPLAITNPYTGEHPSRKLRSPDLYAYPIPIDQPGPVLPTYTDDLDYPFACRTEGSKLGQPLVDNQDQAGTAVYALDDAGNKTEKIIGYSKDCSANTRVLYYYRSTKTGEFLPHKDQADDVEQLTINGETVPFEVRLEIGTINRHIYIIALLRGRNDAPNPPHLTHRKGTLINTLRARSGLSQGPRRTDDNAPHPPGLA